MKLKSFRIGNKEIKLNRSLYSKLIKLKVDNTGVYNTTDNMCITNAIFSDRFHVGFNVRLFSAEELCLIGYSFINMDNTRHLELLIPLNRLDKLELLDCDNNKIAIEGKLVGLSSTYDWCRQLNDSYFFRNSDLIRLYQSAYNLDIDCDNYLIFGDIITVKDTSQYNENYIDLGLKENERIAVVRLVEKKCRNIIDNTMCNFIILFYSAIRAVIDGILVLIAVIFDIDFMKVNEKKLEKIRQQYKDLIRKV